MKKPGAMHSIRVIFLASMLFLGCTTIIPYPAGSSYEAGTSGSVLVAKDVRVTAIDGAAFPPGSSPRTAFILQLPPGKHRLALRSGASVPDASEAELYCDIEAGRRYRIDGLRVSNGGSTAFRMVFTLKEVSGNEASR